MRWVYAALMLAAGLFVLLLSMGASLQLHEYRKLVASGPRAEATITEQLGTSGKSNAKYFSYSFTAGGKVHTLTRRSIPYDARTIPVGTKIPVWFDSAEPSRAVTEPELRDMESWGNRFVFPAVGVALVIGAVAVARRKPKRQEPA